MTLLTTPVLALAFAALPPQVNIAPPTAECAGDRVSVSFTVSEATDVEVAVLDAKGHVVRHLAAGVLGGKNPPPPPLKPGLAQALVWDGKDDLRQAGRGRAVPVPRPRGHERPLRPA